MRILVVLLLLVLASPALAETSIGLPVGTQAPAFELADQNGDTHRIESLLEKGKLAIVFYRSADW